MGFLIFAFRKHQLIQQRDRAQFQSMMLGMKLDNIVSQMNKIQESTANTQSIWGQMMSGSLSYAANQYQATISGLNNNQQMQDLQNQLAKTSDPSQQSAIKAQLDEMQNQRTQGMQQAYAQYNMAQMQAAQANQSMGSVFENQQKQQLSGLQQEETRIKQQQELLNTQLTEWNQELENVKKQEAQEAKDAAPTFGLS